MIEEILKKKGEVYDDEKRLLALGMAGVMAFSLAGMRIGKRQRRNRGETESKTEAEAGAENGTAGGGGEKVKLTFYDWSDEQSYLILPWRRI